MGRQWWGADRPAISGVSGNEIAAAPVVRSDESPQEGIMLDIIAAGVIGVASHVKSKDWVRRKLRYTNIVEKPGLGLFVGAATAVVAAPSSPPVIQKTVRAAPTSIAGIASA